MAMSQSEINRVNELHRKLMELEARLWTLEKEKNPKLSELQVGLNDLRESIAKIAIKRKPGRPKSERSSDNLSD